MSADREKAVSVPTVFVNEREIHLTGEVQLTEEDMQNIVDAVNDSIAESMMSTLKDLQKGLPLIAQFLQNRRFLPKIEGNLTGDIKLKFNDRTLFTLELPSKPEAENDPANKETDQPSN